eukprot:3869542-Amphidinium_carterae.1
MRIGVEPLIVNEYLEAEVSQYKTSRAKDRRGQALPSRAQAMGMFGTTWAETFMGLRKEMGI